MDVTNLDIDAIDIEVLPDPCPVHPRYVGKRKPTSTDPACTCRTIFYWPDHVKRLALIIKPLPLVDSYKGLPYRTVQPRLWAGIITNPGGPWGVPANGRKRSVYYDADANTDSPANADA